MRRAVLGAAERAGGLRGPVRGGLKERLNVVGGGAGFLLMLLTGREVGRTLGRGRGCVLLMVFCTA